MGSAVLPVPAEHPVHYERHRPEHSLLYQLVEEHFPVFKAHLEAQGTPLPHYVEEAFAAWRTTGQGGPGWGLIHVSMLRQGWLPRPC